MKIVNSIKNQNLMSDLYCKQLRKSLFLLLIALAVCGCKSGNEPSQSTPILSVSSPAPAAEADSLKSVLEGVSQWCVMAINKVDGAYSFDLSTEGTTVCFANPYSVSYLSSNTLSIADEQFKVSPMADGGYALIAEDLTIVITE